MKALYDQVVYQCEYCNKRLLTKSGAKIHEKEYCSLSPIVRNKRNQEIASCNHEWETSWDSIKGEEHRSEPSYSYCVKCLVNDTELNSLELNN